MATSYCGNSCDDDSRLVDSSGILNSTVSYSRGFSYKIVEIYPSWMITSFSFAVSDHAASGSLFS